VEAEMTEPRLQLADGATRLFGIVGDPIAQAKSPAVFNEIFRKLGKNAVMVPIRITQENFDAGIRGLKAMTNLDGILVTLPYKNAVMKYVDRLLPAARRIGAVNALRREDDGQWSGDMFDGQGFIGGLRATGMGTKGLAIMLIGAGGAGSAIADAVAEAGAKSIAIYDCAEEKARGLAARVAKAHPRCRTQVGAPTLRGIDILINATPVGMAPGDGLPVELDSFRRDLFVADIVPKLDATPLLARARSSGCKTMGAQAMVAGQADAILRFFRISS
jgi:shikimate dehydrogenase